MTAPAVTTAVEVRDAPTLPDIVYRGFRMWLGEQRRGGGKRTRAAAVASCRAEFAAATGAEADVLVAHPVTVDELAGVDLAGVDRIADPRLAADELWLGRLDAAVRP